MFGDYGFQRGLQEYDMSFLEPHKSEEEMQEEYERKQEALESLAEEQFDMMRAEKNGR